MITIKTQKEIDLLRESGKRLARVLETVSLAVKPGITTESLDEIAERMIREMGDVPSFKDYTPYGAAYPYPASICISVNDEIVHGVPGGRVLREGDIVGLDLGVTHHGMITDSAVTVPVGKIPPETAELLAKTKESLDAGIKAARGGGWTGDIGAAISQVAKTKGYGVVRELAGHGVGYEVHEDPYIPNYGKKGQGEKLVPGMVIAIEPMFTLGKRFIKLLPDGYTIATKDHSLAAHFEHTLVITDGDPEVVTRW
jgi:methionyl aminopeptidase